MYFCNQKAILKRKILYKYIGKKLKGIIMCFITSSYVKKGASYAVRYFDNSLQKASDIVKGILGRTSSSQPSQTVVRQGPRSDMFINSAKGKMLKDKYIESIYKSKPRPIRPVLYKKSPKP